MWAGGGASWMGRASTGCCTGQQVRQRIGRVGKQRPALAARRLTAGFLQVAKLALDVMRPAAAEASTQHQWKCLCRLVPTGLLAGATPGALLCPPSCPRAPRRRTMPCTRRACRTRGSTLRERPRSAGACPAGCRRSCRTTRASSGGSRVEEGPLVSSGGSSPAFTPVRWYALLGANERGALRWLNGTSPIPCPPHSMTPRRI